MDVDARYGEGQEQRPACREGPVRERRLCHPSEREHRVFGLEDEACGLDGEEGL